MYAQIATDHESRVGFSVTNFVAKKIGKRSNLYGKEVYNGLHVTKLMILKFKSSLDGNFMLSTILNN